MRSLLSVFTLIMCAAGAFAGDPPQRTISVTGDGKASAPPNLATVRASVVTQAANPTEALRKNNVTAAHVIQVVQASGVAPKDVQMSSFSIQPVYSYKDGQSPKLTGYKVNHDLTVQVRDLSKLGPTLGAVVKAGSNEISDVTFGVQERQELVDKARREAMADARRRAEVYARAGGVSVGTVQSISEQVTYNGPQAQAYTVAAAPAANAGASVPVSPGQYAVRASVHVTYAIAGPAGKVKRR